MVQKVCGICQKNYFVDNYRKDITKFCSRSCQGKVIGIKNLVHPVRHSGRKFSEEAKKRLSVAHIGIRCSEGAKEKLRVLRSGKNSSLYKDGRSSDKEYRNWQKNSRNRKKRNAEGTHTFEEWTALKEKHNFKCLCCEQSEPNIKLTEDHIVPLSKGGTDYIDNIQPLCLKCNLSKHTKTIDY